MKSRIATAAVLSAACVSSLHAYLLDTSAGVFPAGVRAVNANGVIPDVKGYKRGYTAEGWTVDRTGDRGDVALCPTYSGYPKEGNALQSDNILTLPPLDIKEGDVLRWDAKSMHPDFPESYSVEIQIAGEEEKHNVYADGEVSARWHTSLIRLTEYAGKRVEISFRCTSRNKYMLALDQVFVGNPEGTDLRIASLPPVFHSGKPEGTTPVSITVNNFGKPLSGTYTLTIPDGALTGYKDASYAETEDNPEIVLTWNIEAPAKYDLTLAIGTPKPNAENEISAEKQMDAFFLYCEKKGLAAPEGTENNVILREVDGDYEIAARLNGAFGVNPDYSYFSFNTVTPPTYDGWYEIEISRGAFGDEAWIKNPETGESNDKIILRFKLVDGKTHDIYTIEPESVTPEAGTYEKASDFTTVTVKFPEGIEAIADAYASLAGVNVINYNETAKFVKNEDGTFSATFTAAPSEDGEYVMTVLAGQFGNADFIADNTKGNANKAITLTYTLNSGNAIDGIEAAEADAQVYNMQGIRVNAAFSELPEGIYIVNGKKMVKTAK